MRKITESVFNWFFGYKVETIPDIFYDWRKAFFIYFITKIVEN